MNHPTPITLISIAIVLLWALLVEETHAQDNSKTAQLLALYQECVLGTLKSQVKNRLSAVDPSAAAEIAFQACRTEEQALFAQASAGGVSQIQANGVITDYKLKIKQRVRKLFAEAESRAAQRLPSPTVSVGNDRPPPKPGCSGNYQRYDGAWVSINCN